MPTQRVLEARDLTFGYRRGEPVIDGLELNLHLSELLAVRGPSGCGKSTLLYLLGLMLRPTRGAVLIHGRRLDDARDADRAHARAHQFGFVFQDAVLDPTRSVLDNVLESTLYRRAPRAGATARARELLDRLGVAARAGRRPGQLSGGQAQRIALCRALLGNPEILLADEPTGNLDPASAAVVIDTLRDHARGGGAVVVVTHASDVAARCDRELVL